MPTYEYACSACGHRFEEVQSIKARPLTSCPACKKRKVKRLISGGAGFIFKGSGFYSTDYRSESYKAGAKSESNAATGNGSSSATTPAAGKSETGTSKTEAPAPAKTESKPAATTTKTSSKDNK